MNANEHEKNIGKFIAQLRKEKKMTQKELANQLHITDKAVSKWERGLSCYFTFKSYCRYSRCHYK